MSKVAKPKTPTDKKRTSKKAQPVSKKAKKTALPKTLLKQRALKNVFLIVRDENGRTTRRVRLKTPNPWISVASPRKRTSRR